MTAPSKIHGKTREAWDKMCLSKRRFPDEWTCRAVAQESINKPGANAEILYVYQCVSCRGFHMTRSKPRSTECAPVTATDLYYVEKEQETAVKGVVVSVSTNGPKKTVRYRSTGL